VRTATGAAAALCLIAFGKAMFLSRAAATADRSERPAIVHAAAPLEVLGESPLPSPSASIAPSAGGAASSAPDPAAAPDRKGAAKQKARAQRALDLGQVALAIEAGEQSVGLDPTDSEAWLLLGAAYQEKGDFKNARRCYKACTHEGKRGSKVECAAMLR
jgi:tetratricopeptide (TPR) repeat protein